MTDAPQSAARARNERLTRVGPGTPMGKYMRCFWHPVACSAELKKDAEVPAIPVTLLGEKLALFRSPDGSLGLVQERCPDRKSTRLNSSH